MGDSAVRKLLFSYFALRGLVVGTLKQTESMFNGWLNVSRSDLAYYPDFAVCSFGSQAVAALVGLIKADGFDDTKSV